MDNLATDSSLWAWLRSLAEGNMIAAGAVTILGVIAFIVLFAMGVNLIGKHVCGRKAPLLPFIVKWIFGLLVRWVPIMRSHLEKYLERAKQPKKPLTKRQRVFGVIFMTLYFLVLFIFAAFATIPNGNIYAYNTEAGGILVEITSLREPTDGIDFMVEFDRPAQVAGIWGDVPASKQKSNQFNIRFAESVGLQDEQNGLQTTVIASYPIATPQRSVFLYFKPNDNNKEQLKVTKVKWLLK